MASQARKSVKSLPLSAETDQQVRHPVGDMHRALADRVLTQPRAVHPAQPLPADERLIQLASRILGYAMLVAGFVATGWLIF